MARNALMGGFIMPQFSTPDIGNLIEPIQQGIQRGDQLRQQTFQNERALAADSRDQKRLSMAQSQADDAKLERRFKMLGNMALAIVNDPNDATASANWQRMATTIPGFAEDAAKAGLPQDYRQAARLLAARAGVLPDPLERERSTLQNQVLRRQLSQPVDDGSKVMEVNGQIVRVPRQGEAQVLHTAPGRAQQPNVKEVNGKLVLIRPDGTAQEIYGQGQSDDVAKRISGTLDELATIPNRYDSFQDAVGSFQGGDLPVISQAARLGGSIAATFSKTSPSEVRTAIDGAAETLAATIKPLIRKPGEGTWTDADQKRLDVIVGDLKRANNVGEYNRRLQEVKRRIEASFGMRLPDIRIPADKRQGRAPAEQMPRVTGDADYARIPSGTQYMAPDGSVRTKR